MPVAEFHLRQLTTQESTADDAGRGDAKDDDQLMRRQELGPSGDANEGLEVQKGVEVDTGGCTRGKELDRKGLDRRKRIDDRQRNIHQEI